VQAKGAKILIALVTRGDQRTRQVPADVAKNATPLLTLPSRHYQARVIRNYHR